ncbi:tyrosine-type recombinase/integrase [Streptomyces lasiicapitis]|uniref:tyrosine-type recombinase/integrase n=1 Tax=Streptomyces lasiicapitis TaxID=1923961 RepID=UPI0036C66D57
MARRAQDVYVEWRGSTCRVKWWTGEYHPNGRKRFESEGGFTDEEDAFRYGEDKRYEARHGEHVSNRDGSTLMDDWLDDWLASLDLAHLSIRNYRWAINSHIRPHFEKKAVKEVDILAVRAFKRHLNRALGEDNSRRNVMMVLGMVMDDAVEAGLRKTSPVERKRRRGRYKKKPRERKKDMPLEVIDRLARNAESVFGYSGYVFMWTMAFTGMRPGELFGLTREFCYPSWPGSDLRLNEDEVERYDEDLERYGQGEALLPAIRVERQVQYEDSELRFFPPKYESHRTLVIPSFLAEMLDKLLANHDSDWVFPGIEGGCLARLAFDREYWRPIADGLPERSGPHVLKPRPEIPAVPSMKGKRLYLVRHAHKALLDELKQPRYVVETRMGHEMQGVEGTYSSLTVPLERALVAALQQHWEDIRATLRGGGGRAARGRPGPPRRPGGGGGG